MQEYFNCSPTIINSACKPSSQLLMYQNMPAMYWQCKLCHIVSAFVFANAIFVSYILNINYHSIAFTNFSTDSYHSHCFELQLVNNLASIWVPVYNCLINNINHFTPFNNRTKKALSNFIFGVCCRQSNLCWICKCRHVYRLSIH